MSHLNALEAESIYIIREVAAEFSRPAILYSIGKDSSVLLRLAQKAFAPAPPPFLLLHVDTGLKFREMIEFRDRICRDFGLNLIVHTNWRAVEEGVNPFRFGTIRCCAQLKTKALLDAIATHRIDAAVGGARREEERSRAKGTGVLIARLVRGNGTPRNQRPEMWNRCLTRGLSRVSQCAFSPLSNWTELDIWQYIEREAIPRRAALFRHGEGGGGARQSATSGGARSAARAPRTARTRDVSDANARLHVLHRCHPITRPHGSGNHCGTPAWPRRSERENRLIDHDQDGSMESKKREGYF